MKPLLAAYTTHQSEGPPDLAAATSNTPAQLPGESKVSPSHHPHTKPCVLALSANWSSQHLTSPCSPCHLRQTHSHTLMHTLAFMHTQITHIINHVHTHTPHTTQTKLVGKDQGYRGWGARHTNTPCLQLELEFPALKNTPYPCAATLPQSAAQLSLPFPISFIHSTNIGWFVFAFCVFLLLLLLGFFFCTMHWVCSRHLGHI